MRRTSTRAIGVAVAGLLAVFLICGTSFAQSDQPTAETVAEGRVVFEANCIACHQADGTGLPGVFPPLKGNDHVFDSAHVTTVLGNGLTGEVVVNGTTYNGVMPAFSGLTDDQVTTVIAYLQFGLNGDTTTTTITAGGPTETGGGGSGVGSTLVYLAAALVVLVAAAIVFGPIAAARRADGGVFGTAQVWTKTTAIVAYFVVFTVVVPSIVIKSSALTALPSLARDLIGLGVWFVALAAGMWLLRRAQKKRLL
jgi:mono/diheme cytochrome c family protein